MRTGLKDVISNLRFAIFSVEHLVYLNCFHFSILQSCEEAIMKLKSAAANPQTPVYYVVNQILYPLVQGCESKDLKIIKVSLLNQLLFKH